MRRGVLRLALFLAAAILADHHALARSGEPYWFKVYSTVPYEETWTGELVLKDFPSRLPKAIAVIEANGGKLAEPLKNFVSNKKDQSQQIIFSLPRDKTKALLKSLRKLGAMADPAVRPSGAAIPVDEVRAKIAAIMKEKTDHAADLARVPTAAAAEEEILDHLLMVDELARRAEVEIHFDLSILSIRRK